MKLWKSTDAPAPKRKSKPKPNVLDTREEYLKVKAIVLGGKMKPFEEVGLYFDATDVKNLQLKFPWRAAAESLRRAIKDAGLSSDYRVQKYETTTPGVWIVRVTYEPPTVASRGSR